MKSLFRLAIESLAAVQEKRARARLLTQLDIGLEQEANRAREKARHGFLRFGMY